MFCGTGWGLVYIHTTDLFGTSIEKLCCYGVHTHCYKFWIEPAHLKQVYVCMFSLVLCGFTPGALGSSYSPAPLMLY